MDVQRDPQSLSSHQRRHSHVLLILSKGLPTRSQLEAGNYKKRHIRFQGLPIALENPRGSVRTGHDSDGAPWRTKMLHHYGYINGTKGADKEHVDCYVGRDKDADQAYIVHQHKIDAVKLWPQNGKCPRCGSLPENCEHDYDEDKVMLGFRSRDEAVAGYLAHYDDPRVLGPVTTMPMDTFKLKARATATRPGLIKSENERNGGVNMKDGTRFLIMQKSSHPLRPTVCVDFDGVICDSRPITDDPAIISGQVVPGAREGVAKLRESFSVVVHSARSHQAQAAVTAIRDWLSDNMIPVDGISATKPPAALYIDDHGYAFSAWGDDEIREMSNAALGWGATQAFQDAPPAPVAVSLFAKSEKIGQRLRARIGRVGGKKREKEPKDVFLDPGSRTYPVKIKRDGQWVYDAKLLIAASREARMHGHNELAERADTIRSRIKH